MRFTFSLFFALLLHYNISAQKSSPVLYTISFPNAVHHEAEITATFKDLPGNNFSVRMARSSPGRYALHEFAKNVYNVRAFDAAGKELNLTRPNPHQWDIAGVNGTVKITYTLFGDRADGTYASIDNQHAHLNMPATLMYGLGTEARPASVSFQLPVGKNWKIATQLKPEVAANTFSAPHLQYLMDSPVEIADLKIKEWEVKDNGKSKKIRIAMHTTTGEPEWNNYFAQAQRIVAEAGAVFNAYPDYDFGTYTFLACYMPQTSGDGMEHRNSTFITSSQPLPLTAENHLSTLSHEYFHSWNVERIRPKALEPFKFAEANMSGELWFAEGFTNYYGDLIMHRSQVYDLKNYTQSITAELNHVLNSPGIRYFSPVEMSYQAPFVDAARSIDPVNRQNTYISYYPFGSVIALALDLTLRSEFKNLTLDNYMQAAWKNFGQLEKPYTLTDLENLLGEVTKKPAFAQAFFQKHVYGQEFADYKTLLAPAGLLLRKTNAGKASLGLAFISDREGKVIIQSGTLVGSPLYTAGLEREDIILSIDGQATATIQSLQNILAGHKPGDQVKLQYLQRGETKVATATLIEDPTLQVVTYEEAGMPITKKIKTFRENWLISKAR